MTADSLVQLLWIAISGFREYQKHRNSYLTTSQQPRPRVTESLVLPFPPLTSSAQAGKMREQSGELKLSKERRRGGD